MLYCVTVQYQTLQLMQGRMKHGPCRIFIDLACLDTNKAVFDHIYTPHTVFTAYVIEFFNWGLKDEGTPFRPFKKEETGL